MDENGDAPEHPWARWYRGLSAVERFTIQIAAGLFGGGVFLAAVGFGLHAVATPVSALLDRLGWSLIQLGGAIVVVQVVLHRRSSADQRLYLHFRKTELIDLYFLFTASDQMCSLYEQGTVISDEYHNSVIEDARTAIEKLKEYEASMQPAMLASPELFSLSKLIRSILKYEIGLIRLAHKPKLYDPTKEVFMKHYLSKNLVNDYAALSQYFNWPDDKNPTKDAMRCVETIRDTTSYSADPAGP